MVLQAGQSQMPIDDYLALDALSSGICHTLLTRSPAHARYQQMHPKVSTGAMDLGTVVHRVLLEGHEEGIVLVEADDWRTKAAREARDNAHATGQIPLLAKAMEEVRDMVEVARAYIASSEIAGIFVRGHPEQTLLWQEGTVWCKARPDWMADDHHAIVHVKTTGRSANPEGFSAHMSDMGYDVAAAFYARGLQKVFGLVPSQLLTVFLLQETEPPYACSLIGLSPAMHEIAAAKVTHALEIWRDCLTTQHWPAYPTQMHLAEPRPWQINQMADQALAWHDTELYEQMIEIAGGLR